MNFETYLLRRHNLRFRNQFYQNFHYGSLIKDFPDELHILNFGLIFFSPELAGFQPMTKEK
jgi:hypothetical protein